MLLSLLETCCQTLQEPLTGDDAISWLMYSRKDTLALYEAVKQLSDTALDELIALLTVLSFGQQILERIDAEGSLFSELATDLHVPMRHLWTPGAVFFSMYRKEQLLTIAEEQEGLSRRKLEKCTKKEIVQAIAAYFSAETVPNLSEEGERQRQDWCPPAMGFTTAEA